MHIVSVRWMGLKIDQLGTYETGLIWVQHAASMTCQLHGKGFGHDLIVSVQKSNRSVVFYFDAVTFFVEGVHPSGGETSC